MIYAFSSIFLRKSKIFFEAKIKKNEKGYIKESFEDYFERLADFSFYVVF